MARQAHQQDRLTPKERAAILINDAEAKKGKPKSHGLPGKDESTINKQVHSVLVDEDYLIVAAHVDTLVLNKIVLGEYVDFARLLPRDSILQEDD